MTGTLTTVVQPDRQALTAAQTQAALAARIVTVATVLAPDIKAPPHIDTDPKALAVFLDAILTRLPITSHSVWLLLVGASTVFPTHEAVEATRRELLWADPSERMNLLMRVALATLRERGNPVASIRLVRQEWLADVSFCARHTANTGIQRVVRNTVPHWVAQGRPVQLATWSDLDGQYRGLTDLERARVLAWDDRANWPAETPADDDVIYVPWETTVVIAEVPTQWQCGLLASLARHTPNRVVLIGYDAIPIVVADLVPFAEPNRFVHYLRLIKSSNVVVGISASATVEFAGFATALPAQGLSGPRVVECLLPVEVPASAFVGEVAKTTPPTVLAIGSHEPRKNHLAVVHAAETLWREGLSFRLRFIGGRSHDDRGFEPRVRQLQRRGRPISADHGVDDAELYRALRSARFTVFVSLHEGYGLPVAESLAVGTPVITSDYGSTAEVAAGGGALLVDPRDDAQIIDALRRLLTDDALVADLTAQAGSRPQRTWAQYADRLWQLFTADEFDGGHP